MILNLFLLNTVTVGRRLPHIHASTKWHLIIQLFSGLKVFCLIGKLEAILLWDSLPINNVAKLRMPSWTLLFLGWVGSIIANCRSLMNLHLRYIIFVDEVCTILWHVIKSFRIIKLNYLVRAKSWTTHLSWWWNKRNILIIIINNLRNKPTKIQLVLKLWWHIIGARFLMLCLIIAL